MNVDQLLARLDKVKSTGAGKWIACCPAHEDKRPSLSIAEGRDGETILLKCWSGCSFDSILHAISIEAKDLFPERPYTDAELRQYAARAKAASWAAAVRVCAFEAAVVMAAAGEIIAGRALSELDMARLRLALRRLTDARQALAVPICETPAQGKYGPKARYEGANEYAAAAAEQYRKDVEEVTHVRA